MKVSEFKPEAGKVAVLFVEPYAPSFSGAIVKLASDPDVQVVECASALEAASVARTLPGCLILCHVSTAEQSLRLTTLQRLLGQAIARRQARILLTSSSRDDFENQKLANQLLAELLNEPISEKGLLFKASRLMKLVPKLGSEDSTAKGSAASRRERRDEHGDAAEVELAPALELQSDCWSLPAGKTSLQQNARFIGGRWFLKLHGPLPESGSWQSVDSGDPSIEAWQWVPADPENDVFIQEEGAWIFRGQQPEHKAGLWNFVSKSPELSFFYDGSSYGAKFERSERGALRFSTDSEAGARARQAARASKDQRERLDESRTVRSRSESEQLREDARALAAAPTFEMAEPLGLESDFWNLQSRKPKRVANKWVLSLLGPPPDAGGWARLEGGSAEDEWWQWTPSGADDPFVKEEGAWLFRGTQPKFVDEVWTFVGPAPELSFYYDGENYGSKFHTAEGGRLVVARDSDAARRVLPLIEASTERVIKIVATKEEKEATGEAEASAEEVSHKVPVGEFGEPGGEWEAASVGTQDRRWFVYLSPRIIDGNAEDIRRQGPYWLYFGPGYPKLGDTDWTFRERKPQATPAFGDLPKPIQQFLLDYFGGAATAGTAKAEEAPREEREEFKVLPASPPEQLEDLPEEPPEEPEEVQPEAQTEEQAEEHTESQAAEQGGGQERAEERDEERDEDQDEESEPKARRKPQAASKKIGPAAGSEFVTISSDPIPAPAVEGLFKIAIEELGTPGGKWEVAGTGSDGRRWYVYLPVELLRGVVTDPKRLNGYWTYFGPSVPTVKERTHYAFRARPPQAVARFGELPRAVQVFLANYGKTENGISADTSPSADRPPTADYYRIDQPDSGPVAADYLDKAEPARAGAADYVDKAETPRGIEPKAFEKEVVSAITRVFKGELQGNGPKLIQATHPPGPSLSPIAMAFLMSELICKRDLDRKRIGGRYCEYLSASTGGLRAELWVRSGAVWYCAGTSDGDEGLFAAPFAGGKRPDRLGMDGGHFLAPVHVPVNGREILLGALVLGGAGCELVAPDYGRAVARIARGLVISLGSEQGLPAEPDESAA